MKKYVNLVTTILLIFGVYLSTSRTPIISILGFAVIVICITILFRKFTLILKIVSFALFILLWFLVTNRLKLVQSYILPSPEEVFKIIIDQRHLIILHLTSTLRVTVLGFMLSIIIGVLFAGIMHIIKPIEDLVYPILVVSQSTPTIAIAPLIILWFGFGAGPKIGVVVWATFFPITVNTLLGLRTVDRDMVDVMKAMGAKKLQILKYVTLPHTLAYTLTGIEITSPYAVLGALTAEWMGTSEGMGLYIKRSFSSFQLPQVFAGTIIVIFFSLITWGTTLLVKNRLTRWQGGGNK